MKVLDRSLTARPHKFMTERKLLNSSRDSYRLLNGRLIFESYPRVCLFSPAERQGNPQENTGKATPAGLKFKEGGRDNLKDNLMAIKGIFSTLLKTVQSSH